MRLGPFRLTRHRAARTLAGLVAAFLLSGHVLAAAGLCVVRAPVTPADTAELLADDAVEQGCAGHAAEAAAPGTIAQHHCPADDPSAQPRSVDVPAAQLMAVAGAFVLHWTSPAMRAAPLLADDRPSKPQPLYARLQRLRL